jgi:tripartite ATP-independent transporter DctP family solute receptor
MHLRLTRRSFMGAALTVGFDRLRARPLAQGHVDFSFVQYHNQPETSPLHDALTGMWSSIKAETRGRVDTKVFPRNNNIEGSDPAALRALMAGEIQFFTVMGGILGTVVPAADVQQMPFVFRSAAHACRAMDGPLGTYLREELAAKGIVGFRGGAFDNGMRQIGGRKRPIVRPDDLVGIRMRVPAGQVVADTFKALGAEPVTINSDGIYAALQSGRVDAQENPLLLFELFKLYEVAPYVSLTSHMWSGFNLVAHQPTWTQLPGDIKAAIDRNVPKYVRAQRRLQENENQAARRRLAMHGLTFNEVESAPFRDRLSGLYGSWKERLGTRCWSLLTDSLR